MNQAEEVKGMVVGICEKVLTTLADENKIDNLRVRIDLENNKAKPVFGLFDNSTFIRRMTLKEVVHAGGGKGMGFVVNTYVKKILKDIFFQTMARLEFEDPKRMFVLLYMKTQETVNFPNIAIFLDNKGIESLPIADAMVANENL